MFRKKDEERRAAETAAEGEETAYEDNWYRSLKALSERQDDGPAIEDEIAETPVAMSTDVEAPTEIPLEPNVPETASVAAAEIAPPTDIETRAGRLLERLRSLQRLGDEVDPASEEDPSVSSG
ncbi:MAG: hypothetical protein ACM3WR_13495 [Solirubrobacterales bacterium]